MKKILSFFVLLAGMAHFTACSDNETLNPYAHQSTITVEKAEVTFDANGGIGSVQVSSLSAVSVSIPTEFQWLTASVAGNVINVTVEPNSGIEGRSAQLTIKNANDEVAVTVSQTGLVSRLSTYELEFSDEEGVQVVAFKHDVPVSVQSLSDWIAVQVDDENGRLLVGVASNDVEKSRMGLVAITSGDVKDTLVVFQKAFVFAIEKDAISMTEAGGDQAIAIKHSRPVTFEADVDWITCKLNSAGDTILVSVAKNEDVAREGTVTVKSLAAVRTITVNQAAAATEEPEEPVENPYYGTYTFYFQLGEDTYNMGNFSIVEYIGEDAEEGDVLIIDLYLPGSAIFGVLKPEEGKLYIQPYQDLGYDEYTGLGTIGNLTYSASGADWIVFDITEQGLVSSDFCVLATDPQYTQAYGLVLPSGGTSWFIKAEEAAARSMQRAAAAKKNTFKLQRNKNLPKDIKVFRK